MSRSSVRYILTACIAAMGLWTTAASANRVELANAWEVDKSQSSIVFKGNQMGKAFEGRFQDFDARIHFAPDMLGASYVSVTVRTASAESGDQERDGTLQGSDWFNVKNFPVATYESSAFRQTDDTHFVSEGNLTIRDVTVPVTLPFTLTITEDADSGKKTATMQAAVTLDRSVLQLGRGDWADPKSVANNVDVAITVVATQPR